MKITLKAARINKKMTQAEASSKIGVSKYTISNWERGKSFPDAQYIRKIEDTYGVQYDDIIFLQSIYA